LRIDQLCEPVVECIDGTNGKPACNLVVDRIVHIKDHL
jgi:hypothetical protein